MILAAPLNLANFQVIQR